MTDEAGEAGEVVTDGATEDEPSPAMTASIATTRNPATPATPQYHLVIVRVLPIAGRPPSAMRRYPGNHPTDQHQVGEDHSNSAHRP